MLNPDLSMGLPAFLTETPGLRSGFMIVQVTAVDCLAEMRVLAHPASVDSVTTSANQEDHVSMGLAAARKARQSLTCLEHVVAAEVLCAAQGLDFRRPLRSSPAVERVHAAVRGEVPMLHEDRPLGPDLEKVTSLIRRGVFSRLVEGAMAS
jgi:histidine ammonia-lyase